MAGAEADAATLLLEGSNAVAEESRNNTLEHAHQMKNNLAEQGLAVPADESQHQNSLNGDNGTDTTPTIDIAINNVVCTFGVRCHLNLKKIAWEGMNVEYRREYGKVTMRFRNPAATCTIWSSGRVSITGNTSEEDAKKTARRCARALQKIGFKVRFCNFQVVNVLGTCALPFGIKIAPFSMANSHVASYEPELHPAVTYKLKNPRATLKIFSTGSITVTAPCVENVSLAIQHIYPLVEPYATKLRPEVILKRKMKGLKKRKRRKLESSDSEDEFEEEDEKEDFDEGLDETDSEEDDDDDDSDEDSDDL